MHFRAVPALLAIAATPTFAAGLPGLQQGFETTVRPFVTKYCIGCHSGQMPAAQFDLKSYTSVEMIREDFARWELLAERLDGEGNAA